MSLILAASDCTSFNASFNPDAFSSFLFVVIVGVSPSDENRFNFVAGGGSVTINAGHEENKGDYSADAAALAQAGGDILVVAGGGGGEGSVCGDGGGGGGVLVGTNFVM